MPATFLSLKVWTGDVSPSPRFQVVTAISPISRQVVVFSNVGCHIKHIIAGRKQLWLSIYPWNESTVLFTFLPGVVHATQLSLPIWHLNS